MTSQPEVVDSRHFAVDPMCTYRYVSLPVHLEAKGKSFNGKSLMPVKTISTDEWMDTFVMVRSVSSCLQKGLSHGLQRFKLTSLLSVIFQT